MSRASVLIVDDEASVRRALRNALRDDDYTLLFAEDAASAIALLRSEPVDIILSDHNMPGMTGIELLTLCRDLFPDSLRILLTGCPDPDVLDALDRGGIIYRYLPKPWDRAELRLTVRLASERLQLERQRTRLLADLEAGRTTQIP